MDKFSEQNALEALADKWDNDAVEAEEVALQHQEWPNHRANGVASAKRSCASELRERINDPICTVHEPLDGGKVCEMPRSAHGPSAPHPFEGDSQEAEPNWNDEVGDLPGGELPPRPKAETVTKAALQEFFDEEYLWNTANELRENPRADVDATDLEVNQLLERLANTFGLTIDPSGCH